MSVEEHLFENALSYFANNKDHDLDKFIEMEYARNFGDISKEYIEFAWTCAMYTVYSLFDSYDEFKAKWFNDEDWFAKRS